MRLLDADKITKDSDLITTIVDMLQNCNAKHKNGCLAEDCYECISRYFKQTYEHIQPVVSLNSQKDDKNEQI